ncbi:MAG: endonuclease/exonuclease/phosphatase family protein [Kiritimatiellae bacterium]|nr:endonuclease/exonuclease/phosphatase family protein [Kiritimatiellia bacterium]
MRPAAPLRAAAGAAAALLLALLPAACSPCGGGGDKDASSSCACPDSACAVLAQSLSAAPVKAEGEFTVLTFNLDHWADEDRDGDPSTLEPKPEAETAAILETLRALSPDVILVQEAAPGAPFERLRDALGYPHCHIAAVDPSGLDIAILSRIPLDPVATATNDHYTIGPRKFPVRRGILDATLRFPSGAAVRLLGAHLKSKKFHEFGQAEMRRNEARLVCNRVRSALKADPAVPVLVLGDLNDTPSSAPLQEIRTYQNKPLLTDLRPTDALGDAWTYRAEDDACLRHDYALASATLLPYFLPEKTFIPSHPSLAAASDHRPLFLTFRIPDPATPPPPLPTIPAPRPFSADD